MNPLLDPLVNESVGGSVGEPVETEQQVAVGDTETCGVEEVCLKSCSRVGVALRKFIHARA